MSERNYFINGITELLILSFLKANDGYIYEITHSINELSVGMLSISQNTLYASVYKLENDGKISEYSKLVGKRRVRVYYHIEQSGLEFLDELYSNYNNTVNGVNQIISALSNHS